MAIFDDLIKRASEFVEKQKGAWDHSKWQDFLSDAQKKGVKLTEEMQNNIGQLLESIKKFYESSTDTGKKGIENLSDLTAKFIEKTKGQWEHLEWEKFVKDIQQKGIDLTEETRSFLGEILENSKKFYFSLPLVTKEAKEEKVEKDVTEEKEKKKVEKLEKKEPEVTKAKAPKKVEAPKALEAKALKEEAKPTIKKAEEPKKEKKPPVKKEAEIKVEEKPSKKEEIKAEKKEPAKKTAVKKPAKPAAKESAEAKAASVSKKK